MNIETDDSDGPKRWFDPHLVATGEPLRGLIQAITGEVLSEEKRCRARSSDAMQVFRRKVDAVICNLALLHLEDPESELITPRGKSELSGSSRYRSPVLGKCLPGLIDTLAAPSVDLLQQTLGCWEGSNNKASRRTTIRPSERLAALIDQADIDFADIGRCSREEVIILKTMRESFWDDTERMEYADTPQTIAWRKEMQRINGWIAWADISLLDWNPSINLGSRKLRRVFNSGRLQFDHGGRLFGGFWQPMNKDARRSIIINGNRTVTLDFDQVGPKILYGMAGGEPLGDAYDIAGYNREGVKKVFAAMTQTGKPLTRMPDGCRSLFGDKPKLAEVVQAITHQHSAIADCFNDRIGMTVMYTESQIMVSVLLELMARNIVALPIHDALVVEEQWAELVKAVMLEQFHHHTGIQGSVSRE